MERPENHFRSYEYRLHGKDATEKISEQELELLHRAENDKENGRLTTYTSHRDILGR
ncbi:hypothetical protein [Mucilaginibacter sp.]|uniref:hypothetical protein n=1 Tax=Mucilaginibacter sp. TaxID=1882438 RepID=UPI00260386F0|nr:hypothetical protein [Mucilaginibacter sp.]MDB5030055.1 hypothetical protein [Mucilaginibacter sp.]